MSNVLCHHTMRSRSFSKDIYSNFLKLFIKKSLGVDQVAVCSILQVLPSLPQIRNMWRHHISCDASQSASDSFNDLAVPEDLAPEQHRHSNSMLKQHSCCANTISHRLTVLACRRHRGDVACIGTLISTKSVLILAHRCSPKRVGPEIVSSALARKR